jgi:hypothetical protein
VSRQHEDGVVRLGAALLSAAVAVGIAACGGGGSTTATSTADGAPLTDAQAAVLSQVLYKNLQAGGADLTVNVAYGAAASLVLTGAVDWNDHIGQGRLETRFTDGRPSTFTDLLWTSDAVIIADPPGMEEAAARVGRDGIHFVARPPSPDRIPLDRVIAISVSLAATQRDNPLLVQQSDARFLGRDAIDGHAMERYRYKDRAIYWVGVDDGLLHRLEATINGFAGVTTFDLTGHGPRHVTLPSHDEVIDTTSLPADALAQLQIVPTTTG